MKKLMSTVAVALIALTAVSSASAQRYHGGGPRFRAGIYIGGPVWGGPFYDPFYSPFYPPYYAPPVYVQPAPVVVQRAPETYVERTTDYWYYCAQSAAYYPYVKECPAGWMQVVAGGNTPK